MVQTRVRPGERTGQVMAARPMGAGRCRGSCAQAGGEWSGCRRRPAELRARCPVQGCSTGHRKARQTNCCSAVNEWHSCLERKATGFRRLPPNGPGTGGAGRGRGVRFRPPPGPRSSSGWYTPSRKNRPVEKPVTQVPCRQQRREVPQVGGPALWAA